MADCFRLVMTAPIYLALLQMGQLGSDQPHVAASRFSRVVIIGFIVLLVAGAALAGYLIWRSAVGKPRDESHIRRTTNP